MKPSIFLCALLLAASAIAADLYVYASGGTVRTVPREIPSVGVRIDTRETVLGLHGADDATKAACGWFRVVPSATKATTNQYVAARAYTLGKTTAQEVLTLSNRVTKTTTTEQRVAAMFDALPAGMTADQRCGAIVKAVAQTVTNRLSTAVTVTIPAATKAEVGK